MYISNRIVVRRVTGKKSDGESILINIAEHSLAFPLKWTEHEEKHKKISFEILLPYSTQFNHSIYVYSISETFITSGSKVYRMTHQMNLTQGFAGRRTRTSRTRNRTGTRTSEDAKFLIFMGRRRTRTGTGTRTSDDVNFRKFLGLFFRKSTSCGGLTWP